MYNPMNGYMAPYTASSIPQRINNLYEQQQFNSQFNNPMYRQNNMIKCRAVTSFDEAKASMIDLDGSINVFTDIANKRIYTKQINLDGTATIEIYVKQEQPQDSNNNMNSEQSPVPKNFVTQDELEAVCLGFNSRIQELQNIIHEKFSQKPRYNTKRRNTNNKEVTVHESDTE